MQFKRKANKTGTSSFEDAIKDSIKTIEDKETIHIFNSFLTIVEEITEAKAINMPFIPLSSSLTELSKPAFLPCYTEDQESIYIRCKDVIASMIEEFGYTTIDQNGFAVNPSIGKDLREEGDVITSEEPNVLSGR